MLFRLTGLLLIAAILPAAETRRALVVGINVYQTGDAARTPAATAQAGDDGTTHVARQPVRGAGHRNRWSNLEGAVPDATLMRQILIERYGFSPENIIFLTDRKNARSPQQVATAQRILDTFQSHLIDHADSGDVSVFFFAGHGSRIRNLMADRYQPPDPAGMDQTLAPADSEDGVADIRDKELVRLYRKAVQRGVRLTVIADSCHSGGMIRGAGRAPRVRDLPEDPRTVSDPPDLDPKTGKPLPDPTTQGVLVIAAAQDNEAAAEMESSTGQSHGVFTNFFSLVLRAATVNEPVSRLFSRTVALMRSAGQLQLPTFAGEGRWDHGLFGQPAGATAALTLPVQEVRSDNRVILRGGVAAGITQGCELAREGDPDTRLRVDDPPSLTAATARIIQGGPIRPGDMFRIDRWIIAPDFATRFYVPSSGLPILADVKRLEAAVSELGQQPGITMIEDPTAATPTDILRFGEDKWELESRRENGVERSMIARITAREISSRLGSGSHRLFVDFPIPRELAQGIRGSMTKGSDAVTFVDRRDDALYQLTGTRIAGKLVYSWLLAGAGAGESGQLTIPVRTDWIDAQAANAASRLDQFALNISRLRLWLQIDVPGGGNNPFPYSLAFKNTRTGELQTSGEVAKGEEYSIILKPSPQADQMMPEPRWIYVLDIDSSGKIQTLFPLGENSSANHLPLESALPGDIKLGRDLIIDDPLGVDTIILLASEEPVDPYALQIDPVRTRGPVSGEGPQSNLTAFLLQVRGGTRGGNAPAPTNWNLERLTFRTVARKTK